MRRSLAPVALVVALVVTPWVASSRAEGFLYWATTTRTKGAVARANLDGTDVQRKFITFGLGERAESASVSDVAVNARHVFWAKSRVTEDKGFGSWVSQLGRAGVGGSGRQARLVTGIRGYVEGVAVAGRYVYWTWNRWDHRSGQAQATGIGRAKVDGTAVDRNFITISAQGLGLGDIAVDSSSAYWAGPDGIGRAALDGSVVDPDFIALEPGCFSGRSSVGVAVDASYVYWTAYFCDRGPYGTGQGTTIGRANLDGTGVDPRFAAGDTGDIEVDPTHFYWAASELNVGVEEIWRTAVDGSRPETVIPNGNRAIAGLAVDDHR